MAVASLVLEALAPARPRWWGDFSPSARGPVTSAGLAAIPVPLPSTVAGALAAALGAEPCRASGGDPLACQEGVLRSFGVERFRGPLLVAERGGRLEPLVPVAPQSFSDLDGRRYSVESGERVGVALSRASKSVLEGYLYLEELAWGVRIGGGGIEPYRLLMEVKAGEAFRAPRLVLLGGERPAFKADTVAGSVVEERLASLWGGAWGREAREAVIAVATPAVLPRDHRASPLDLQGSLERALKELLGSAGVAVEGVEPLNRCTITALGLGYDVARNLPRPYEPVLLPGCLFRARASSGLEPRRLYREGIGRYAQLGWGTVLPLPPGAEDKLLGG